MTSYYEFNPIQGWTELTVLREQIITGAGIPAGTTSVRINVPRILQGLLTVMATSEMMARNVAGGPQTAMGQFPSDLVVGTLAKDMLTRSKQPGAPPYVDIYVATQNVARWMGDTVSAPRKAFPEVWSASTPQVPMPPPKTDVTVPAGLPLLLKVGVIGVAAAAAAAFVWWAERDRDAMATVELNSLRLLTSADVLQRLAIQQVASGQPIDPGLIKAIGDLGRGQEQNRSWEVPVAIAGSATLVVGGGAVAVYASK